MSKRIVRDWQELDRQVGDVWSNRNGDDECAQSPYEETLHGQALLYEALAAKLREDAQHARANSTEKALVRYQNMLASMTALPTDWDEQGAEPPSTTAAFAAYSIVSMGLCRVNLHPTRIDPSVEEGVVIEYHGVSHRYCLFECYNDGEVVFLYSLGVGDPKTSEAIFSKAMSARLWNQILSFCEGHDDCVDLE